MPRKTENHRPEITGAFIPKWPMWSWTISEIKNEALFTDISKTINIKTYSSSWNEPIFAAHYEKEIRRHKLIKSHWLASAVLIIFSVLSFLGFATNYLSGLTGLYFLPFAIFSLGLTASLIRIRSLRRSSPEPNLIDFCSGNENLKDFVLGLKVKRPPLFFSR